MRKIFTLLLSLVLLPLVAWGQDEITGNWKDQISEAVEETDYQVVGNTYNVYTAKGLAWVANQINEGAISGKYTISLQQDIDLGEFYWTPIEEFTGSFNGNGYSIKNLSIKNSDDSDIGLIEVAETSGSIANVTLENVSIIIENQIYSWACNFGSLIGELTEGTVENCHVSGSIQLTYDSSDASSNNILYCGGLIGYVNTNVDKISMCTSDVDITATGKVKFYIGNLIGSVLSGIIVNCASFGDIHATVESNILYSYIGGLIGSLKDDVQILNCVASGTNTCEVNGGYSKLYVFLGGLFAEVESGSPTVANCVSSVVLEGPTGISSGTINKHTFGYVSTAPNTALNLEHCYYKEQEGITAIGGNITSTEELKSTTSVTDINVELNSWIASYTGSEDLLEWENGTLVKPDLAIAGKDYEWDADGEVCTIKTQKGLFWVADQVNGGLNSFEGKTIKLAEGDWDLSEEEWIPIGCNNPKYPFKGTFDGNFQEVTLGKFSSEVEDYQNKGFFGYVENGTIQNLIVNANFTIAGQDRVAIVVNEMYGGKIDHVTSKGEISSYSTGGIAAYAENVTFSNCINEAKLSGSGYSGGICENVKACTFESCYNVGQLTASETGGICAIRTSNDGTALENCAYLEGTAEYAVAYDRSSVSIDFPAHTEEQFKDGTVTKILGEAFGQRIGEDKYPVWMAAISEGEQEDYKVYSVTFQDKEGNVLDVAYGNKGDEINLPQPEEGKTYTWYDADDEPFTGTSVTLGDEDIILSCEITINTYSVTLTANPTEGGHFLVNDAEYDASSTYNYGTEITIEAVPADGYIFKGWADGETEAKRTETVKSAITLTANFEKESEPEEPETPDTPVTPDYPDYYNIYVEECEGVTVETSTNVVREGNSMSFTIEVAEGYTAEDMVVKVKRSLFGYTDIIEPNKEGKYEIRNIYTEIYITVEGVEKETPTGIEEITGVKVYTKDGSLYVQTPKQEQVVIISISGTVIKNETQIGLQRYDLPRGIYIVRVGTQNYKIRN